MSRTRLRNSLDFLDAYLAKLDYLLPSAAVVNAAKKQALATDTNMAKATPAHRSTKTVDKTNKQNPSKDKGKKQQAKATATTPYTHRKSAAVTSNTHSMATRSQNSSSVFSQTSITSV